MRECGVNPDYPPNQEDDGPAPVEVGDVVDNGQKDHGGDDVEECTHSVKRDIGPTIRLQFGMRMSNCGIINLCK